ncbi:MAG: hypothetical protein ACJ73S_03075 [Mycobacteriales bacterium]
MSELKHPTSDQPAAEATAGTDASTSTEWLDRLIAAKRTDTAAGREPYAAHLDKPLAEGEPTAREVLDRFDPRRANLPDLTPTDAVRYIETHAADRPWLAPVRGHDTAVQRLFATLDQGHGHALERHEGYPSDSLLQRRVQYLEDPAQLDLTKRLAGEDAYKPGKDHQCAEVATKIGDPEAFATAFARGMEHPDVRAVLDQPLRKGSPPSPVAIPIGELLGADGARYCSGYQLRLVGGDIKATTDCRTAWVDAYRQGREPDAPAPIAVPIDNFQNTTVRFVFAPDRAKARYEVFTMYVDPPPTEEDS